MTQNPQIQYMTNGTKLASQAALCDNLDLNMSVSERSSELPLTWINLEPRSIMAILCPLAQKGKPSHTITLLKILRISSQSSPYCGSGVVA